MSMQNPTGMTLIQIETAPSGKRYVHNHAQSPAMCDIADKYGVRGYRSDYRDCTQYTTGMDGYWFFENEAIAAAYIVEALPVLTREMADEYALDIEDEAIDARFWEEQTQIISDNNRKWAEKYPHGKRIPVNAWGGDFQTPAYAIKKSWDENGADVIAAAICRKNRMIMSSRLCPQGQSVRYGKIESSHYSFTMGIPCRSGGVNGEYQVWIAV